MGNISTNGTITAKGFIGNASSASKLNTNAGSSTVPVYFSNGVPVACSSLSLNTSGNAATASKWQNARTLSWTGDATGSMSVNGSGNTSASLTLAASGVTAGSYGPSSNTSPGVSGAFSVPYFTVDSKGRITSAVTRTITMPTDTKVTNTKNTTTKAYITGTTSSATNTGTQIFDTGVYLSATAGELVATKFTGALNGNATTATTATKLGTSTIGSAYRPIYLNSGTPTASSVTLPSALIFRDGTSCNLNSFVYGRVTNSSSSNTVTNKPFNCTNAMTCWNIPVLSNQSQISTNATWQYLVQVVMDMNGRMAVRTGQTGSTTSYSFGQWKQITESIYGTAAATSQSGEEGLVYFKLV